MHFYVETVDAIRHVERKRYFVSLSFGDKDGGEIKSNPMPA
jgi:hypothetical protein